MTDLAIATSGPCAGKTRLLHDLRVCGGWALTTYERCEFRCVYCITGAQGESTPIVPPLTLPRQLRRELAQVAPGEQVMVGTICDAYPTVEEHHRVTRAALEVLVNEGRDFLVVTKGTLVVRDRDLFASQRARVTVSLCSVNEQAIKHVDPRAPSAAERLASIHALVAFGVNVSVSAAPWIPGVSDVSALLARLPPGVPVCVAPLNVTSPEVAAMPFARRFSQREINEAYLDEFGRLASRPFVTWLRPVRVDDAGPEFHPFSTLSRHRKTSTCTRLQPSSRR